MRSLLACLIALSILGAPTLLPPADARHRPLVMAAGGILLEDELTLHLVEVTKIEMEAHDGPTGPYKSEHDATNLATRMWSGTFTLKPVTNALPNTPNLKGDGTVDVEFREDSTGYSNVVTEYGPSGHDSRCMVDEVVSFPAKISGHLNATAGTLAYLIETIPEKTLWRSCQTRAWGCGERCSPTYDSKQEVILTSWHDHVGVSPATMRAYLEMDPAFTHMTAIQVGFIRDGDAYPDLPNPLRWHDRILGSVPIKDGLAKVETDTKLAYPGDRIDLLSMQFCSHYTEPATLGLGSCAIGSTLTAWLPEASCKALLSRLQEHMAIVEALVPPPGATVKQLMAWRNDTAEKDSQALMADAKSHEMLCKPSMTATALEAAGRLIARYQKALLSAMKKEGVTKDSAQEYLGAERNLQMLGFEGGESDGLNQLDTTMRQEAARIRNGPGATVAKVLSPVILHAYREDGAHAGWNATRNATDLDVPGTAYAGAPGGYQELTLPAGAWRLVIDELEDGNYTLLVDWNGTNFSGAEEFHAISEPGRTTSTYYVLDETKDGARMELYPFLRGATPAHAGFLGPLKPFPEAPPAPATASDPESRSAGERSPATDVGQEQSATQDASPAPTPGIAFAPFALLIAILAALRRRN